MFEWDPEKSEENKKKHGISFEEVTGIWQSICLEFSHIARSKDGESRSATVGLFRGEVYTVIWTGRGEKIRIISARKARNGEKKAYFEEL